MTGQCQLGNLYHPALASDMYPPVGPFRPIIFHYSESLFVRALAVFVAFAIGSITAHAQETALTLDGCRSASRTLHGIDTERPARVRLATDDEGRHFRALRRW